MPYAVAVSRAPSPASFRILRKQLLMQRETESFHLFGSAGVNSVARAQRRREAVQPSENLPREILDG